MRRPTIRKRLLILTLAVIATCLIAAFFAYSTGPRGGSGANETALSQSNNKAVSPSRVEARAFYSQALNREMPFRIYLPPGYDSNPAQHYPVLYMLHGMGGDAGDWQRCGLFKAADDLLAAGEIEPLIIVTPDGGRNYWVNAADGKANYGAYITNDLVSFIDDRYRTVGVKEARAIGGMSMGGHGALQLALNSPGTFSVAGAHSVALRTFDEALPMFGDRTYFRAHDPVQLVKDDQNKARRLEIWIDIGTSDRWYAAASAFHDLLTNNGIEHEWRTYAGGHDAAYWSAHVTDYLRFYSQALMPRPATSARAARG